MTTILESDGGAPRLKDQLSDIKTGSPLALLGLFVEVVRVRFKEPNTDTGYVWRPDPTPLNTEESTEDEPRFLYVESSDVNDPEARDMRPAIFVTKGETQLQQLVIGNRSDIDHRTRTERFYMPAVIPITLSCVSENRGESAIIADHAWFHIASATNYIRALFGINHIAPPMLGPTNLFRRNEGGPDLYMTMVSFAVTVEFHWITRPIAPLLKEVLSNLTVVGGGDAMIGAMSIALRTSRTR